MARLAALLAILIASLIPTAVDAKRSCVPRSECCKVCDKGKACGNTCISRAYTCHVGRGCACNTSEVCPGSDEVGQDVASTQSPFEEDDTVSPPASTSTKDPFQKDDDAVSTPSVTEEPTPSLTTKPTPRLTGGPTASRFRVVSSSKVTVRLRSPDQGATFSILSGRSTGTVSTFGTSVGSGGRTSFSTNTGAISSASFERVCTAPCTVEIDPGVHRWLLELPDGRSGVTDPVLISGDATMEAEYLSNSGPRVVLGALGTLALVVGLVMNVAALDDPQNNSGLLLFGLGSDLLGLTLFGAMAHVSDSVEVRRTPTRNHHGR